MDALDYKLIKRLVAEGRVTWSDLASELGLSSPSTADRVRRLEEQGVITGYTALINPEAVGSDLTAFVAVSLERPEHRAAFLQRVAVLEEVQECHHIAGDDDYLLKVRSRNTRDLDRIISTEIKGVSGVIRTKTTIVMYSHKETPNVPIFPDRFLEK